MFCFEFRVVHNLQTSLGFSFTIIILGPFYENIHDDTEMGVFLVTVN